MAFDQNKYIDEYVKENYDRIVIKVPKGKKDLLKREAQNRNIVDDKGKLSVTRLIVEAIEQVYGVDMSRPE